MKNEIDPDYSKRFLLPPALEDWIPDGHPARFIREFVEKLNTSEMGFKERTVQEGRPNYSNKLMLKIWLYGYFEKIYSTRELEKACKDRIALVWLTGMNYPDHNTIWRFFRDNKSKIKNIFKRTIHIAIDNEMVGFALQAIDGTKIYANASRNKAIHKKDLEKLLARLETPIIDEVVKKINKTEKDEKGRPSCDLPRKLQDKNNLTRAIEDGLEEYSDSERRELKKKVQANIKKLDDKKKKSASVTDPESNMMKTGNSRDYCYNAQGVVDDKHQIIVGAKVTSDEVDHRQMTGMLDEARSNCNKKSTQTLADGGYFSGTELQKAEEKGYPVITPVHKKVGRSSKKGQDPRFSKEKFRYDPKEDVYICPLGGRLEYLYTNHPKTRDYPIRRYGCRYYKTCEYRHECSKSINGKKIDRTPYDDAIYRQIEKNKSPDNKQLYDKRKQIIEPVFGWIKHNKGFTRWLYRGLNNVDAQWNLICTGINLSRLFRLWKENRLVI